MNSDLRTAIKEEDTAFLIDFIRDLRRENAYLRKQIAIHKRFSRKAEKIIGRIERKLGIIGKRKAPVRRRSKR